MTTEKQDRWYAALHTGLLEDRARRPGALRDHGGEAGGCPSRLVANEPILGVRRCGRRSEAQRAKQGRGL